MGGGPAENLLILLPVPEPTAELETLKNRYPNVTIKYQRLNFLGADAWKAEQELDPSIYKNCTILFTLAGLPPKGREDAPNLQWIHFFSAGINSSVTHPIWKDDSIILTTSSGVHGPQIAEWFTMTLLVQNHSYNLLHDDQKKHAWRKDGAALVMPRDLVGQRLGVLGYGSIGRQAARVGKALGMQVFAYTATLKDTKDSRKDHGFVVPGTGDPEGEYPSEWYSGLDKKSLHHFLEQDLDVLLISVPLTEQTHHFLSTSEFEVLSKQKTFISNIARGQIIDQEALIMALRKEQLRGAALDVTDPEPLPEDSPLWDLPNVTITPHISGLTASYTERSFMILDENIERKAQGKKLWNQVDRKRGY